MAITDPLKVYQAFQSQRGALQRLHDIIYSELRVELGRHELLEIVSSTRADIMKVVTERANEKASAYGIEIQDVRIKRADLPTNEKAVFARMQAERERRPSGIALKERKKRKKSDRKPKRIGKLSLRKPTKNLKSFAVAGMPKRFASMLMPTGRIRSFSSLPARWKRTRPPSKTARHW